jgi:tetratricopeptide (TPR) repeat protein
MGKNSIIFYTIAAVAVFITVTALGVWVIYQNDDIPESDRRIASADSEMTGKKKKNSSRQKIEQRKRRLHNKIKRKKHSYKPVNTGVPEIDSVAEELKGMSISEDKIELLDQLDDVDSPALPELVKSVLDDDDPEVRLAALELLEDKKKGEIADCLNKALDDPDEDVREYAATLLYGIEDKEEAADLLIKTMDDSSENVREAGFDVVTDKEPDVQLPVFEQTIHSPYKDIKENTADAILDIPSHKSVTTLFEGLKDPDQEFVEYVNSKLDYLFGKEFKNYDEAINWWNKNKDKFDEDLFDKD